MHNLSDSQRSSQLSLRLSQSRGSTGQLDLNEINDHIELCIEENNL